MNPLQLVGIIVGGTVVFAGVVTLLAMQGVPILLALLGVYVVAVAWMFSMQRRAREIYDSRKQYQSRHAVHDMTRPLSYTSDPANRPLRSVN